MYQGKNLYLLALITALLSAPAVQAAKLYKWTDEAGTTHYSHRPAGDKTGEEVIQGMPVEVESEEAKAPVEITTPPLENPDAALQTAERCQELYYELGIYKEHSSITDSEGTTIVISPEMREAKLQEINDELDQKCR